MAKNTARKSEQSTESSKLADPAVLGVTLPLSTTVSAAQQVADAWKSAMTELLGAVKGKLNVPASKAAKPAEQSATQPAAPAAS
jgi:hypothetical protein